MNIKRMDIDMIATSQFSVKLIKSRMRHKRIFGVLLSCLLFISATKWPEDGLVHEIMQWAGYILILCGIAIRMYSSLFIGGFKNDRIIDKGPYSIVRNPLYVGTFLITVGIGLQTASFILTFGLMAIFMIYYHHIVAREEEYLQAKFGLDFTYYKNWVPRWMPNFSIWKNPTEMNIHPRFVLMTARDCLIFLIAIPAFELLHHLQKMNVLNTFIQIF